MSSNRLSTPRLRVFAPLLALGLIATSSSYGQTAVYPTPRIHSEVSTSQMVPLKGNVLALAKAQFDRGAVPDGTPTGHMLVVLKRSDDQQKALDELVAAQQDPKSKSYHKWLTPDQFGAQFGVADADVQTVSAYLSSQGFSVGRIFKNKMAIEFSGTTGQVHSAFRTEIHNYVANGQAFHANASAPQIPMALAPVIRGVTALNNFKQPAKRTTQMLLDRKTGLSHPLYSDATLGAETVSPGDLATIYDIPTAKYTGTGVTVGIISDSNINVAIPANYRTTFGLAANAPVVIVDGNDPGITEDADLAYAQIELIAATAPAAKVNLYTAADTDLDTGINYATLRAVEDNDVQVLVFGFESCEANLGDLNGFYSIMWQQASAEGMSVIADAGNGGAAGCDFPTNGGTPVAAASNGLAVNGYASTPYATAVGASDFYYGPTGSVNPTNPGQNFLQYWNEDNGGTAGYTSAKSYIPEQPDNASNQATNQETFTPFVLASGGGVSTVGVTNDDGTLSPEPQPSYQLKNAQAAAIGNNARVVPDVSIFGGNLNNGSAYILCIGADDCVGGAPGTLTYSTSGGSDIATGAFGGIAALIVQAKGAQGNLNPILYATQASTPNAFHDISAGTNAVSCVGGSPNCGGNGLTTTGGGLAYQAAAGYDAASGLGSVDVANLINGWTNPTGAATVTLSLTVPGTTQAATIPFAHNAPVQLNVAVTGTSGQPTGDVSITTSVPQASSAGVEVMTLTDGKAVDSAVGQVLPGGSYNLIARYAGDSTFAPAVASIAVTVNQITSAMAMLTTDQGDNPITVYNGQTVAYGTPVQFTFQVYNPKDLNDPIIATGSVTLSDNGKQLAILPLNSEGFATFKSSALAGGAHSFNATYSGDATFTSTPLTGPAPSVTIGGVATTTILTSTSNNVSSENGVVMLVATVASGVSTTPGASGTTAGPPTGSVRFNRADGSLLGTVALGTGSTGSTGGSTLSASTAYTVPRGQLSFTTSITATYVPAAASYLTSTSTPIIVKFGSAAGLANTTTTLTTTPLSGLNFLSNASLNFTAAVAGGTTPTGTVTFYGTGTTSGAIALGTQTLDASGSANVVIPKNGNALVLPLGQDQIFAQYNGDATHAASSGYYIVHIYDQTSTPDFSMQSDQTFHTISAATPAATFTLQFTSLNGLAALASGINLSYQTPLGITCGATPTQPNFSGGTYTTVNVSCGPSAGFSVGALTAPQPSRWWMAGGGAALACVFLFGMPTRRRSWQSLIGTMALFVVAFGITGCGASVAGNNPYYNTLTGSGGGSSTPNAAPVLGPGTYTVIVTGTVGVLARSASGVTVNAVHNLPLKIVVQ